MPLAANARSATLPPPLKWAGGKRWLVPHLKPIWALHQQRRLVEPFCGGLAVALGLRPARVLLNDINPHTINFYQHLKRGLRIELPMAYDATLYYTHRARFNTLIAHGQADSAEAASLFYYLNRTGYNGLCRFNQSGQFNVPFGRYTRVTYTRDFSPYRACFAAWDFISRDFAHIPLHPDDLIYADPPYDVEFTAYSRERFTWNDQVRLAEWLACHPGPVLLSNQATPRIVDLYTRLGFRITLLTAPRMINNTGDRTPAQEVLATLNTPATLPNTTPATIPTTTSATFTTPTTSATTHNTTPDTTHNTTPDTIANAHNPAHDTLNTPNTIRDDTPN